MTKPGTTLLVLLLDESGSMQQLRVPTIAAIREFVVSQRSVPGERRITFATFDDPPGGRLAAAQRDASATPLDRPAVEPFLRIHVKNRQLDQFDLDQVARGYQPRGGTPLNDAMGTLISLVGQDLASLTEGERPSQVIFVVQTDGYENASHTYTAEQVRQMVEHQSQKYGWEFVFLGAGIDAQASGRERGILRGASYSPTGAGTRAMSMYLADTVGAAAVGSLPEPTFDVLADEPEE